MSKAVVIIGVFSAAALAVGGFFFFKKKKESDSANNKANSETSESDQNTEFPQDTKSGASQTNEDGSYTIPDGMTQEEYNAAKAKIIAGRDSCKFANDCAMAILFLLFVSFIIFFVFRFYFSLNFFYIFCQW